MARYEPDLLKQFGLPPDHDEVLADYNQSGSHEPFDQWQLKWLEKNKEGTRKPK